MGVFIVTGKLGQGKTLLMASRIDLALAEGRQVATNLDIHVNKLPSIARSNRSIRLVRVPDKPTAADIESLGYGCSPDNYDESKFGALVLDECGTWLNSREWNEGGRRELLDLLLHIRKRGWHVYLIIQDISMLDKQVRKAIAEHVVYTKRLDNIRVPLVNAITKVCFGRETKLPRMHLGIVKLGDQQHSLIVDRWTMHGNAYFDMYDTRQVFQSDYPHGVFSVLPPGYLAGYRRVKWGISSIMRITKIYLRKYSLIGLVSFAGTIGLGLGLWLAPGAAGQPGVADGGTATASAVASQPVTQGAGLDRELRPRAESPPVARKAEHVSTVDRVVSIVSGMTVQSGEDGFTVQKYRLNDQPITQVALRLLGIDVQPLHTCQARITDGALSYVATC